VVVVVETTLWNYAAVKAYLRDLLQMVEGLYGGWKTAACGPLLK